MGETTGISWATASWNPWYGCKMVSAGCSKCYMFREMRFYGRDPNVVQRAAPATFNSPLRWARSGKVSAGARIFTCSWSDWFIDKADEWRPQAWKIVRDTPQFVYMILTKRPERIGAHLPADWGDGYPNVWLGVTTENQAMADERIPELLRIPAHIHWLSVEPMIGAVDLTNAFHTRPLLNWIITGGESDPSDPRPCNLDWVRTIRDQCQASGVAYFHKQHGGTKKIDGAWGGRVLDGRTWDEFPVSLPA